MVAALPRRIDISRSRSGLEFKVEPRYVNFFTFSKLVSLIVKVLFPSG